MVHSVGVAVSVSVSAAAWQGRSGVAQRQGRCPAIELLACAPCRSMVCRLHWRAVAVAVCALLVWADIAFWMERAAACSLTLSQWATSPPARRALPRRAGAPVTPKAPSAA
jgi:hypothetical protein